jgi:3-hydroxymyristoyl/3-hydroxydecanoyl-(acyl carrier protein) dehydratase
MTITTLALAADHPAYAGHFPGMPVLPGVVLLDATVHALEEIAGATGLGWEVASAKFQSAVRPGEPLTLQHETLPDGSVRFSIRTADRPVASGVLVRSNSLTVHTRGEQG